MGGEQLVERGLGLGEQRSARSEIGLLAEQGDAGAGVQAHLAVVGLVEAGEEPHEGRLADAVGTDQADALAGVQLEADVLEQRPLVEAAQQMEQLSNSIVYMIPCLAATRRGAREQRPSSFG